MSKKSPSILSIKRREEGVWDVLLDSDDDSVGVLDVGVFVFERTKEWRFFTKFHASGWSTAVISELGEAAGQFRDGEIEPIGS